MPLLQSPSSLLLLSYALLALGMLWNDGRYAPPAFALVIAALAAAAIAGALARRSSISLSSVHVPLAAAVLVVLIGAQAPFDPAVYIDFPWYAKAWPVVAACVMIIVAIAYLIPAVRESSARPLLFFLVLAAGLSLKFLVPFVSPAPHIDVFYMMQSSARSLLQGLDPYMQTFADIYRGRGLSSITTYTYLPGNLLMTAPFFWLIHDVRLGMLAAECVLLFAVWRLARPFRAWAELLVLLFLFHPRGFFVIEQSWIDPLLLGALGAAVLLWSSGRERTAAVVFGWMLSLKHYLLFFPVHVLLLRPRLRLLPWAFLGLLLPVVPFAIWHWGPFLQNGVLFHLHEAFRPDNLSLGVPLRAYTGWRLGPAWSLLVGAMTSAATLKAFSALPRLQGFLLSAAITTFALFALGSQAFCNYYYLASGLIVLALASASFSHRSPLSPEP